MPRCPECDSPLQADPAWRVGEVVSCPSCRGELEVIGLEPLELAIAPELDEDWGE